MPTKGISVRLDEGLLEWADRYAEEHGASRTSVLETALVRFRGDCSEAAPESVVLVKRSGEPAKTREDFAAGCAARAELFKGLAAPESVRFGTKKEKG